MNSLDPVLRSGARRRLRRPLAIVEAAIARRTVRLAPEPPGERAGVIAPDGAAAPAASATVRDCGAPLRLVAVGDSLVAGCGVAAQDRALVPRIARILAAATGRDVQWSTHARLGATMRRVRYRFLPEVDGADLLLVCAGSNDLMARRGPAEWTDIQTDASVAVCAERGVPFVDVAHCDLPEGFWADDGFHPGAIGYEMAAAMLARPMLAQFTDDEDEGARAASTGRAGERRDALVMPAGAQSRVDERRT